MRSVWWRWVWVCGPDSQAVNDGVSEACAGALEQHRSRWAKPKDWSRKRTCCTLSLWPLAGVGDFTSLPWFPAGKSFSYEGEKKQKEDWRHFTRVEMISGLFIVEDNVSFQKAGPYSQYSFHLGFILSVGIEFTQTTTHLTQAEHQKVSSLNINNDDNNNNNVFQGNAKAHTDTREL